MLIPIKLYTGKESIKGVQIPLISKEKSIFFIVSPFSKEGKEKYISLNSVFHMLFDSSVYSSDIIQYEEAEDEILKLTEEINLSLSRFNIKVNLDIACKDEVDYITNKGIVPISKIDKRLFTLVKNQCSFIDKGFYFRRDRIMTSVYYLFNSGSPNLNLYELFLVLTI